MSPRWKSISFSRYRKRSRVNYPGLLPVSNCETRAATREPPVGAGRALSAKVVTRTLHCVKRLGLPGENETGATGEARLSQRRKNRLSIVPQVKSQTACGCNESPGHARAGLRPAKRQRSASNATHFSPRLNDYARSTCPRLFKIDRSTITL